jgi:hypothetical protein
VLLFAIVLKLRCQSKVTDLQVHVGVDEQIAKLEISMDHTVAMQVLACHDQVVHEEQGLGLIQAPTRTATHILIQGLVGAHLKDYKDIVRILKMIMELDYVLMIQSPVDCNLRAKLRTCTRLGNCGLRNNLGSKDLAGVTSSHLVALGKAALSQETPLAVARWRSTARPPVAFAAVLEALRLWAWWITHLWI